MERAGQDRDSARELAPVIEIAAEAFEPGEDTALDRVYVFDPLRRDDSAWGFVIVTRSGGDGRLELAAFSWEVDEQGTVTRRLESRRAKIPAQRIEDVIEGIVLRLDEPDCSYREFDLSGHGARPQQLRQLRKLLLGEDDVSEDERGELHVQPGESDQRPGSDCDYRGQPD